ncbi:histone H2A-beta, sperm-like isoform X1 [Bradysia coprophila]|uniref:histone H2A-beta, sperm-like isoform X1 n=1 Tax=Bradysia coprophila TaxID=38358 RepID=UPI00187DBDF4|nr:histone H2A-beta, sperm-like isoform X1 [Bradysia coprophila]
MESTSRPRTTKSQKAGCIMSIGRIERNLRKGNYAKRISSSSAVCLTSVLEYLCAEVLELAGNAAQQNKRIRITPRHIMLAIENDAELKELLKDVQIPEAGVMPNINPVLLKTRSEKNHDSAELDATSQQY